MHGISGSHLLDLVLWSRPWQVPMRFGKAL